MSDKTTAELVERKVGITVSVWYFPEFDQWKLSFSRNSYGQPIWAIGPLRILWKPVTIWRSGGTP